MRKIVFVLLSGCMANAFGNPGFSVPELALSVSGLTEYGLNEEGLFDTPLTSGKARTITITNDSSDTLSITYPSFPSGTKIVKLTPTPIPKPIPTACTDTLAASSSCTITIQPGNTASPGDGAPNDEDCTKGYAPTYSKISISTGDYIKVYVLGYGCKYQGGYVYAFNDNTDKAKSVGGKVVTRAMQDPDHSWSSIWSSNGATTTRVSFDLIPGIANNSTVNSPVPTYEDFNTFFSQTYSKPTNPFTSDIFKFCDGNKDGQCNTNNISAFYNKVQTNQQGNIFLPPYQAEESHDETAPATALDSYAAGICSNLQIKAYSDWYLPAICEMGYTTDSSVDAGCGSIDSPSLQNIQKSVGNITHYSS